MTILLLVLAALVALAADGGSAPGLDATSCDEDNGHDAAERHAPGR